MTLNAFDKSNETTLNETTYLVPPIPQGWEHITLDDEETDVQAQVQSLIRDVPFPWRSVELISRSVQILVMDVLQQELDDVFCVDAYRAACIKCLRALSKARNIVPSSFVSRDVTREGVNPVGGDGFADIWKGNLHDTQVCLKVLRLFISGEAREKLIRDFCHEALVWRQLHHPNVLPFLGVSKDLFAPSYCLISPWMVNGNVISYLETHPDHDRLDSLVQIAEGMEYLHNHDPPIVHADIRGANVLVVDDLRCCLADFGLSLFAESQVLDSSSRMSKGSIRWLAPEYMDSTLFNQSYLTARDIYAYGCTVIEIFTGKPPFSDIKNEVGVMHEVVTKQNHLPRPPLDIFPNDLLWSIVRTCLATAPSHRPDATQVIKFLTYGMSDISESPSTYPLPTDSGPFWIKTPSWTPPEDELRFDEFAQPVPELRSDPTGLTNFLNSDEDMLVPGAMPVGDWHTTPWDPFFTPYYEQVWKQAERAAYQASTPPTNELTIELPLFSDAEDEADITFPSLTAPSTGNSKRRRSSSPEVPLASRSASPTFPKTGNIVHLQASQISEETDAPRAKRTKHQEKLICYILATQIYVAYVALVAVVAGVQWYIAVGSILYTPLVAMYKPVYLSDNYQML